jgi:hypothetical protein
METNAAPVGMPAPPIGCRTRGGLMEVQDDHGCSVMARDIFGASMPG